MSIVGEAFVRVRPETTGFGAAVERDVSRQARTAGAVAGREAGVGFRESFGEAAKVGLGLIAITGVVEGVKSVIEASAHEAGAIALLDNAARKAGAANELYGESIAGLVRKQSLQKGFSEEELFPAFSRLITATGNTGKAYKDLGLAQDVARQRGIGVTQAALALAKAEDGSVTSLQRLGIILPKHIRDLQGAAKETAALEFVQSRFGGAAARFAATPAGEFARFGAAVHELKDQIGVALVPELEGAAAGTADWLSKSENLARVQTDVAGAAKAVAGAAHVAADAFHIAGAAIDPFVHAVGGVEKAAELAFGGLALRRIQKYALAVTASGAQAAAAETESAVATTAYTAALEANTAALLANAGAAAESQVALYGARGEALLMKSQLGGVAAAAETGAARLGLIGRAGTAFSGVLKSGIAPAAVLAGYELSTFIRKIPGWESTLEGFGGTAAKVADKLGLLGQAATKVPSGGFGPGVQTDLRAAYEKAVKAIPDASSSFAKEARDKLVASIVGPGYTFHDAQVFAQQQANAPTRRGAGVRRNYDPAAEAAAVKAGRPTDVDYQIQLQQALQTKTTADERALYEGRLAYVSRRVALLQADNNLTADQKKNLLRLETEQVSLQGAIQGINDAAASAAKQAADAAKRAAEAARAARQKAQQAYSDAVGLREQGLQLNAARAQLTDESSADDRTAAVKLLAFYRAEAADTRLTKQQRAHHLSQSIGEQQQIIGIDRAIHDKETQAYRDSLSLTEQRLQLQAKRAELTGKSIADDKAAARKLIAFYTRESHDVRRTAQERSQFASQAIDERIALKNLKGSGGQGATVQQIFAEAASEFRSFGSNIASRNGILSGQDARAAFGAGVLGSGPDVAERAAARQRGDQLTELQRQTAYLARIAKGVDGGRNGGRPAADAITDAKLRSRRVGVG